MKELKVSQEIINSITNLDWLDAKPDQDIYEYFDKDFNPVDQSKAAFVRIIKTDGTVIYGVPVKESEALSK